MPLNDEEFNELLHKRLATADEETSEDREALTGEALTGEDEADLALLREALDSYKVETLTWAQERSATMPSPQPSAAAALWDRVANGAPRWALAGIAAAACAVAIVNFTRVPTASSPVAVAAPDAQVLAVDNRLLSSVDDALAANSFIPSEQQLGLSSTDLSTRAENSQEHGRTQSSTN